MLKLYHGATSTCSKRVRICLAEKGLDWESVHIDLSRRENLDPEYLRLNPNGVVPTLIHDGRVLYESNFIIEYLDEEFPDVPLRPKDPYERARMRIWMDRIEHVLRHHSPSRIRPAWLIPARHQSREKAWSRCRMSMSSMVTP